MLPRCLLECTAGPTKWVVKHGCRKSTCHWLLYRHGTRSHSIGQISIQSLSLISCRREVRGACWMRDCIPCTTCRPDDHRAARVGTRNVSTRSILLPEFFDGSTSLEGHNERYTICSGSPRRSPTDGLEEDVLVFFFDILRNPIGYRPFGVCVANFSAISPNFRWFDLCGVVPDPRM